MLLNSFKLIVGLVAAVAICSNASAQSGSTFGGFGGGGYASSAYGGYGALGGAGINNSCGRAVTQSQAESLWAGYCTESCAYQPAVSAAVPCGSSCAPIVPSCGHGGGGCKLKGLHRGSCGGGGCDQGGFGYPSDCGCGGGCDDGSCDGVAVQAGPSCGHGGCKLGGKLGGGGCSLGGHGGHGECKLRGRGTGLFSGFLNTSGGGCLSCKRGAAPSVPVTVAPQCGAPGSYFNEFVGPEYGNAGIQSSVSGCATGACGCASGNCGGHVAAPIDLGYGGGQVHGADLGGQAAGPEVQGIVNQAVQDAVQGATN